MYLELQPVQRSALITGATGFVGSHLVETLAAGGWRLRALVRATSDTALLERLEAELVVGDLADSAALAAAVRGVDVVFHLAGATTARDESGFVRTNAHGTARLCDAVAEASPAPRRLVYLSSYAACGPARSGRPRAPEEAPEPLTAYGRTKLEGEAHARALESSRIEVVVLRAPAVYGPGDRALLPFFRLVRRRLAPVPTGAERRLHVIFAPDLARALVRAADAAPGTYAVAEPAEHTWAGMTAAIGRALGRRPLRVPVPAGLVRTAAAALEALAGLGGKAILFNREKAEEMLAPAWTCDLAGSSTLLAPLGATPLDEGIARTVEWYRGQGWLS